MIQNDRQNSMLEEMRYEALNGKPFTFSGGQILSTSVGVGLVLLIAISGVLLIFGLTLLPNGGISDSSLANLVAIKTTCTICQTLPGEKGEKVKIFSVYQSRQSYVLTSLHLLKRERPEPGKRATKETRATRETRGILAQIARFPVQMECASPIHFSHVPRVTLAQMALLDQ